MSSTFAFVASVLRPPRELLLRVRWSLMLFVPLSLVPWLIALAHTSVAQLGIGLLTLVLFGVSWSLVYRRDELPPLAFELAHFPIALAILLAAPHVEGRGAPGEASLFTISMLLQSYAGPWVRLLVRLLAMSAATLLAVFLTQHTGGYILFGLASANLFSYLLATALETERRSLRRAGQLTAAAARLSEAASREELERLTAEAVRTFVACRTVHVRVTEGSSTPLPTELGPPSLSLNVSDPRGVSGRLQVELEQPADRDLSPSLSTLLAIAVQNGARLQLQHAQHEMAIAAELQASLLPKKFTAPAFEIAGAMLPASEVGGDYFDVIETPSGCFVGIGDVAGHGLPAGLVMLMTQSVVSSLVRRDPHASPRDVVCVLNETLYENVQRRLGRTEHVTFSLLRFGIDGQVVHAGAHEDILVWRAATGQVERIATKGTWLGACPDVKKATVESHFRLEVGDVVLLHTDGITETRSATKEQFGLERLETALAASGGGQPETSVASLLERVARFSSHRTDDWTLLLVRYVGPHALASLTTPTPHARA